MDSNWLPGLLGEGDDIRSYRPTSPHSQTPETNADDAGAEGGDGSADAASDLAADSGDEIVTPTSTAEAGAVDRDGDPSEEEQDVEPIGAVAEADEDEGEEADEDEDDFRWRGTIADVDEEDFPGGDLEPEAERDSAGSGATPSPTKPHRNGGPPATTDAFSRWTLPPVRRIETRRLKPVDPDKLPSYLRGHPRFER